MTKLIPKITIDGVEVDYLDGNYTQPGGLGAATLTFKLPILQQGMKKLWNKEVLLYLNESDGVPIFRGYIKRVKETFEELEIFAQDILGYMVKGGDQEVAKIVLTDGDNLDGLTASAAITKALSKANLSSKLTVLGDTSPAMGTVRPPIRGALSVLDIIKKLLSQAVNNNSTLPRPNIARIIENGSTSQLVIELEADVDSDPIVHAYTEHDNIISLSINERRVPTVIVVNGSNGVSSTFTHDTARSAFDRNYLEVTNETLTSPAECKDFAIKLFEANLKAQYEYGIEVTEGGYLNENDIIRITTEDERLSGNYRVIGKAISFSPNDYSVGITINKKPPTLAEYISSRDN
tara:strand:+ start:242 stop:1288 length:1047 start_codon:yes stop_codon:yes gene_type:complete